MSENEDGEQEEEEEEEEEETKLKDEQAATELVSMKNWSQEIERAKEPITQRTRAEFRFESPTSDGRRVQNDGTDDEEAEE